MKNIRIQTKIDPVKKAALIAVLNQLEQQDVTPGDSKRSPTEDWRAPSRVRKSPS